MLFNQLHRTFYPIFASDSLTDNLRMFTNIIFLRLGKTRANFSTESFFTNIGFGPAPISRTLFPQKG